MMSKILNVVIILLVIAGAVYGYYFMTKPDTGETTTVTLDENGMPIEGTGMTLAEQDPFVQLLNELNSITIDTEFLESGALLSFVDYTRTLRTDAVGRDNPFASLGASGSTAVTKQTTNSGGVTF